MNIIPTRPIGKSLVDFKGENGQNLTDMTLIISIGGGSGSGKTFLANHLKERLGERCSILSYDNYYKDQGHLSVSDRAKVNYDDPNTLDSALFIKHLKMLKEGKTIEVPQYDFATHTRKEETTSLKPNEIIIAEGILVYSSKDMKDQYDYKIFVDADPDIRLVRRIRRDVKERGRTVESVLNQYLTSVRPSHLLYVEPSKKDAEYVFLNNHNDGLPLREFDELLKELDSIIG